MVWWRLVTARAGLIVAAPCSGDGGMGSCVLSGCEGNVASVVAATGVTQKLAGSCVFRVAGNVDGFGFLGEGGHNVVAPVDASASRILGVPAVAQAAAVAPRAVWVTAAEVRVLGDHDVEDS